MPTLMDVLMQQRMGAGGSDYTMGSSRGGFAPYGQPAGNANGMGFQPRQTFGPPMPMQGPQMAPQVDPVPQAPSPDIRMPPPRPPEFSRPPAIDYQSNNLPALMQPQGPMMDGGVMPQSINWGDPNNAADFFRADQMLTRFPGLLGG